MISVSIRRLLLTCSSAALISSVATVAMAQDAESDADETAVLDTVTVQGVRSSIQNQIALKKNSSTIVDGISAEDIGKLPDENVVESLQRINGVQIQRRNGEGAGVSVRGLPQNRLEINGVTLVNPTGRNSGPDEGTFPVLQFVPSELLSGIEVAKASEADRVEGSIGGTVTLKTHRPLALGNKFAVTAQAGYADRAEEIDPRISGTFSRVSNDGQWGVLLGVSFSERSLNEELFFTRTGWSGQDSNGDGFADTNFAPGDLRYQTLDETRERLGVVGTIQYEPSSNTEFALDLFYSSFDLARSRSWWSSSGSGGNDPAGYLNGSAVVNGSSTILAGDYIAQAQGNGEDLTNESETINLVFSGTHEAGPWEFSGILNFGEASQADDQDFARVRVNGVQFSRDFSGSIPNLSVDPAFGVTDPGAYTSIIGFSNDIDFENEETAAQFDVDYNMEDGFFSSLEAGVRWADQSASRRQLRAGNATGGGVWVVAGDPATGFDNGLAPAGILEVVSLADVFGGSATSNSAFLAANPHGLGGRNALLSFAGAQLFEQPDGGYSTDETIWSAYGKANFESQLGNTPFSGNVGVRYIETEQTSVGNLLTAGGPVSTTVDRTYDDILPSLNLRFDLTEDLLLRFAAAKVISRPPTNALRAGVALDEAAGTASGGNPELNPFEATGFDVSFEYYPSPLTAFTATAFYKDVGAFFETRSSRELIPGVATVDPTDNDEFLVSRVSNGQDGTIQGIELGATLTLDNGFGGQFNYTYLDSETPNSDPSTGSSVGIEGLSEQSWNLIGFYENDRFSARAAYNWRSDYLVATSFNGSSLSEEDRGQLDVSFAYNLRDNIALTFEAINLNNDRVRQFSVLEERNFRIARTDRRFFAGIRASF